MSKKEELYKWNKILFNDLVKPVLKKQDKQKKRAERIQARLCRELEEAKQARLERHARFIADESNPTRNSSHPNQLLWSKGNS